MSDDTDAKGQPVLRDKTHYSRLFSNSPAQMPADYTAKLDDRTTYELMLDRDSKKSA